MSDSFNIPGKCESLTDCANCSVDCLSTPVSEAEEKARQRGAEQYAIEHTVFTPSQLLNDIRMHNSNKAERTNNTFIQRYLENRHPNSPKNDTLREDLDSAAFDLL
jgi:hypothetical protein